jgi:hypothetical protein
LMLQPSRLSSFCTRPAPRTDQCARAPRRARCACGLQVLGKPGACWSARPLPVSRCTRPPSSGLPGPETAGKGRQGSSAPIQKRHREMIYCGKC